MCGAAFLSACHDPTLNLDQTNAPRIVSTSLCGDGYVIEQTPAANIVALSWQADHDLSTASPDLRQRPKAWDSPERLLALRPDLVVFGPGEGRQHQTLLERNQIATISLQWGEDFKSIRDNQAMIGEALDTLGVKRKTRMVSLPTVPKSFPSYQVLYLSSSGATAGTGTYINTAIEAAGGLNIMTQKGWFTPDPETIISLKPDLIITSFFAESYASVNQAGMRNPIYQKLLQTVPTVHIDGKHWPCAGPNLGIAVQEIHSALSNLNGGQNE